MGVLNEWQLRQIDQYKRSSKIMSVNMLLSESSHYEERILELRKKLATSKSAEIIDTLDTSIWFSREKLRICKQELNNRKIEIVNKTVWPY